MSARVGIGKKRELNSDLNLTPFIDLLSTMVCFLLIAAVWVQVGEIEIKQSFGTKAAATSRNTYEMDVRFISDKKMNLAIKKRGRIISKNSPLLVLLRNSFFFYAGNWINTSLINYSRGILKKKHIHRKQLSNKHKQN